MFKNVFVNVILVKVDVLCIFFFEILLFFLIDDFKYLNVNLIVCRFKFFV